MKKIFYWSPYLSKVATIEAVINSVKGIKKYSNEYEPILINACGEFDNYKKDLTSLNIKVLDLTSLSYHKYLPYKGFILSRISFIVIFLISFLPLLFLIKSRNPTYFISHLITSLPIIISNILNNNTKYILRISGLPRMTFLRNFLWKMSEKKLFKIFCPTTATMNHLILNKVFPKEKINLLRDPVINISKVNKKKKEVYKNENYFVCIGRLTKQKNFSIVIDNYKKILQIDNDLKLYIIGEGEDYYLLKDKIYKNNLEKNIFLIGYRKNIFKYLQNARFFLLSSLWEDPGWVLIEAAASNTSIISSNCKNGPQEFIEKNLGGILFKNNDSESLLNAIKSFYNLSKEEILRKKIFSKRKSVFYTTFRHYKSLEKNINDPTNQKIN